MLIAARITYFLSILLICSSLVVGPTLSSYNFSNANKVHKEIIMRPGSGADVHLPDLPKLDFLPQASEPATGSNQPSASFSLTVVSGTSCNDPSPDPENVATGGDDTIYDTSASHTINGGDGNDQLFGCNGQDTLNGQNGNDILDGGEGKDTLNGGDGADTLIGGNGKDDMTGGTGADTFDCGHGDDNVNDFKPVEEGDTAINCENATGVDNIPPDTTITSAVDGQNNPVSNGGMIQQILSHSHSLELTI